MYAMNNNNCTAASILCSQPSAVAFLRGSGEYPNVSAAVRFYQTNGGVLIYTEANGLPRGSSVCSDQVFGFHIHSGGECSGNADDAFADAKTHYDTRSCPHPAHAGDMPPLFGNNGKAVSVFLTGRFNVSEIIGRTVIIHAQPDDFTTQPSGNSGKKIACGVIRSAR